MVDCNYCGNAYEQTRKGQKYCSPKCNDRAKHYRRTGRRIVDEEPPIAPMIDLNLHLTHRAFFDALRRPIKKKRACLRCRTAFLSTGNRLCSDCTNHLKRHPVNAEIRGVLIS